MAFRSVSVSGLPLIGRASSNPASHPQPTSPRSGLPLVVISTAQIKIARRPPIKPAGALLYDQPAFFFLPPPPIAARQRELTLLWLLCIQAVNC
jgi:hypothetical protein